MMDTYIRMIRKYFNKEEHKFYFIRSCAIGDRELFKYGNMDEMQGANRYQKAMHLYKALDNADIVIWHGFIYPARIALFLCLNKRFLRKSIWIMWGLDLHNWKRPKTSFRNILVNFINYNCRNHMKEVIALVEQDRDSFYQQFSSKIPCHIIQLPMSEESFALLDSYSHWKPRKNGKVFIQIAHNAYSFNRHIDVLNQLKKFKDENIRLFLPLSYGGDPGYNSASYIKDLKKELMNIFLGKAYCINKLMPLLDYTDFLWNMDIAIFNAQRQNGLGNILKLLYVGNKVFLPSDGPLYHYFKEKGIDVYDTLEIQNMDFETFISRPNKTAAQKWILETHHPDNNYRKWKEFFDHLGGCTLNQDIINNTYSTFINSEDNIPKSAIYKRNYLNLSPYLKVKRPNNIKNLTIIGVSEVGKNVVHYVQDINKKKLTWYINGFIDEDIKTLNDSLGDIDIIGTMNTWRHTDKEYAVCTYQDPYKRYHCINNLPEYVTICSLSHPYASISRYASIGQGVIIAPFTYICENSTIGDYSFIMSCKVLNNVVIGNYCNIGYGCVIGEGTVIEDFSTIDNGVYIPPYSVFKKGSHIKRTQQKTKGPEKENV